MSKITKLRLVKLAKEVCFIENSAEGGKKVSALLRREGGALGGARPKIRICISQEGTLHGATNLPQGSTHWLLKFNSEIHPSEANVELVYSRMAREAGIDVPETRLIEGVNSEGHSSSHFAIARFDRAGMSE